MRLVVLFAFWLNAATAQDIHEQKCTASDGAHGDLFGFSVSIIGDSAVVGARADDADKGSAYVFKRGVSFPHAGWRRSSQGARIRTGFCDDKEIDCCEIRQISRQILVLLTVEHRMWLTFRSRQFEPHQVAFNFLTT